MFTGDTKDDAKNFDRLCNSNALGPIYDLISYLFYIKNPKRYLPNKPSHFEISFALLGEYYNFKMSRQCSWSNYQEFINRISEIRTGLEDYFGDTKNFDEKISMIDAHSFCWIIANYSELLKIDLNCPRLIT